MKVKRILASVFAGVVLIGSCVSVAVGYNGLSRQIEELTKQVETLTTENKTLSDKTTDLETANKSLTDKTTELEEENKSLSNKVTLLTTEVNAEIFGYGILRNEYIEANLTHSANYYYSEENEDYIKVENSTSYPETRTYVIKDETALKEAYSTPSEIDFEKEMLVIHFYTDIYSRVRYLGKVQIDENNVLKIEFDIVPNPGVGDASMPVQKVLVVKVDKLEVNAVEFKYLKRF